MIELALKLVLAHLVGDFLVQPDKWVKEKEKNKIKSPYLYYHILIHFLLLLTVTQFSFLLSLVVTLSHFLIDIAKIYFGNRNHKKYVFFIDQFLHFFVIAGVVYFYHPYCIFFSKIYEPKSFLLLTALVSLTYPTSMILKTLLAQWELKGVNKNSGINNAGKYIGILERLFIFLFVVINFWEGIGFLLAAKSIFRFGDLKESKDVQLTEYILIGTLLSFGFGILISLAYKYLETIL